MISIFGIITVSSAFAQDKALNGTWESSDGEEFIFNNTNFEIYSNAVPNMKGTYTANDGKIFLKPTHLYGLILGLENKWFSVNEISVIYSVEETAFEVTWDYFIRGNRLSIIIDEKLVTYIKQ
jgi:hypothetical protein